MSVHQFIKFSLTLSVCLILSLSVNHASAQNLKCEKQLRAIEKLKIHDEPISMPKDSFLSMDGTSVRLQDFIGQTVLLNHWAVWCPPCLREMPSLISLSKKIESKNAVVIPLSMDRSSPEKVNAFIKKKEWQDLTFYQDQKMAIPRALDIRNIPVTQIINKSGLEIARVVGMYEWDNPEVLNLLDCLNED
ncbi:MAG: TlpA family protein disulfide reductase [Methylocystaceae bacterium]|nr:TlpA family protein disulfide reductase [Methylocystaceae bacterium]